MITIGDTTLSFDDPVVLVMLGFGAVLLLIIVLLITAVRRAGRSAEMIAPLAQDIGALT